MRYPKPIMSITELSEMGFNARLLHNYCHVAGQQFAFKTSPRGKWLIDTERFDAFWRTRGEKK